MKGSIIIISFFIVGLLLSLFEIVPSEYDFDSLTLYALYALMFFVGISVGIDSSVLSAIREYKLKIILPALGTIVGTLLGVTIVGLLYTRSLSDCLAVGSGFGYYSLSTVIITQYKGIELGTVALLSNIMREVFTLLFAPLLVTYFGRLAPISAGGATTMDTTLPIITRYSGSDFVIIAIVHGFLVDLSVPFLVTLFCTI